MPAVNRALDQGDQTREEENNEAPKKQFIKDISLNQQFGTFFKKQVHIGKT